MRGVVAVLALAACGWTADAAAGAAFMAPGGPTSQPIGHLGWCQSNREDCVPTPGPVPARVPTASMREVARVQAEVNAAVRPATDRRMWDKEEVWSLPSEGRGDCEDFALLKRSRLLAGGLPKGDLLIAVVRKPDGEGHAVLIVRMEDGDYVLDNLAERPTRWDGTRYRFVKRQSETDPGRWVSLGVDTEAYAASTGPRTAVATTAAAR